MSTPAFRALDGVSENVASDTPPSPVTIVVTRRVRPGHESRYEAWLQSLLERSSALPGYLGATIQCPPPTGAREYTSVFRFDTVEHLREFETSEIRHRALVEVAEHVEGDAAWKHLTGLEFWFAPPPGAIVPQPSRARMALLMIGVVYVLVLSIGQLVGLVLGEAPAPLRLLVTIIIEVSLMTWIIMPRLTRLLARWIYPVVRQAR